MTASLATDVARSSPDARARAAYLVRRRVLDRVGSVLGAAGLEALLVKGAGLAETVYPSPWMREMVDIDLVVRPEELEATLAALAQPDMAIVPIPVARRRSFALLGERAVLVSVGPLAWTVEVHSDLDRIAPRPIDWFGIRARAATVADLPTALKVPSREDHAVLVVLHAVLSGLEHPQAWADLDRLWRSGVDAATVAQRCREWGLATGAAVTLEAFSFRHPEHALDDAISALGVAPWRRRLARLALSARPSNGPVRGIGWIAQQGVVRDDPVRWCAGVLRYAASRVRDRGSW